MKHFTENIINQAGVPVSGASVTVFFTGTQNQPTIYSDDGVTPKGNPVMTDTLGRFDFYVADGRYDLAVTGPTLLPFTLSNIEIADLTEAAGADTEWVTEGLRLVNQGVIPGAAPTGDVNLYTKTLDKRLYYKDDTGTEIGPLIPGGTTSPVNAPSPFVFNTDMEFKGINPYVDIRAFGARASNPNTTPASLGLTATINSGVAVASVSSASTFVNGDGVVIYGAGPLNSLSVPSGVAVTNVLAAGGTGTGVVAPSAAGSTTKCYQVVARDTMGGLTAASSEVCTSTSQSVLGVVTVPVISFSRSGATVTVTTSTPHPVLVGTGGGEVFISGASDVSFNGWYPVATAADANHFTWTNPVASTVNGSPSSATGGTATFYPANHVTWTAVPNAWLYYIYCGPSGGETLCGVSNPQGTNLDTTWDDFATLQTNWLYPPYIPNNPPSSPTADMLSTTIISGAGSTSLVLANAASTSVSGAIIRLDAAPGIRAAGAQFRIPADSSGNSFVVNSFVDLRAQLGTSIEQAGTLVLNETLAVRQVRWNGVSNAAMGLGAPGAWSAGKPLVSIFGGARPGLYVANTQQSGPDIRGISFFGCSGNNGCLLALVEGGFAMNFDTVDFTTGQSANDLMGIGLYLRGSAGQSAASVVIDKVAFGAGNTSDGTSHNGTLYCNLCGDVHVREAYSVHRGMLFSSPPAGGTLQIDNWHINGGGTPFVSVVGGLDNFIGLGNVIMDTIGEPCVSSFASFTFVSSLGCQPSSGITAITGGLIESVTGSVPMQGVNTRISGTTSGLVSPSPSPQVLSFKNDGPISVSQDHGTIFVSGNAPAVPTAAVSAGGSLSTGVAWNGVIVPVWAGGFEGTPSGKSNTVTTTPGNQTVTITGTPLSNPSPQCYNIYVSQNGGGPGAVSASLCVASPSFVFSTFPFAAQVLGTIAQGGPTMLMPGTQGIATPALVLGGSTVTAPASGVLAVSSGSPTSGNLAKYSSPTGSLIDSGVSAANLATVPLAVGNLSPGSNGQCVNTSGSAAVWGSCAGTAGVQTVFTNPNGGVANTATTNVQTIETFSPGFAAGALNTLGKTFRLTNTGAYTVLNSSQLITFGLSVQGGTILQPTVTISAAQLGGVSGGYTLEWICMVTATGSSGILKCGAVGTLGGAGGTTDFPLGVPSNLATSANLTTALGLATTVQFGITASASNTVSESWMLVEQLN